jgi:hypothetical protein
MKVLYLPINTTIQISYIFFCSAQLHVSTVYVSRNQVGIGSQKAYKRELMPT